MYPNILRLRPDGSLYCADGQDVQEYLKAYYQKMGYEGDVSANLMDHEVLSNMYSLAMLARDWPS